MNELMVELTTHPNWNKLRASIKLSYSKREAKDSHPHPKFDIPRAMLDQDLLLMQIHCPRCSNPINPVRQRYTAQRTGVPHPTGAYVSLVCPVTVNPGCCRSNEGQHAVELLEKNLIDRVAT